MAGVVQIVGNTTAGLVTARVNAAATTNATLVKGAAGQVYAWSFSNPSAAAKFVRLFNKATAPTVGTDTPVLTIALAAGATVTFSTDVGIAHSLGIGYDITGANGDADATAVAANDVTGAIYYV